MIKYNKLLVLFLVSALVSLASAAGQFLSLKMGPQWPRDIFINTPEGQRKTAWEAEITTGKLFQNMIGFGGSVNFLFHRTQVSRDSTTPQNTTLKVIDSEDSQYMFPVLLALQIDPLPKLVVRPLIQGQVGVNMLVISKRQYVNGKANANPDNGFYIGPIGKFAVDAVWNLVEQFGFFGGFQYEISTVHARRGVNLQKDIPMYGPGIRMGIRMSM
jgi:hypothetical protein